MIYDLFIICIVVPILTLLLTVLPFVILDEIIKLISNKNGEKTNSRSGA